MRLSELTAYEVSSYLMLDEDEDTGLLPHLLAAAKSYIAGYTGLDETELDAHEDITVAALILCADLYDNRLWWLIIVTLILRCRLSSICIVIILYSRR